MGQEFVNLLLIGAAILAAVKVLLKIRKNLKNSQSDREKITSCGYERARNLVLGIEKPRVWDFSTDLSINPEVLVNRQESILASTSYSYGKFFKISQQTPYVEFDMQGETHSLDEATIEEAKKICNEIQRACFEKFNLDIHNLAMTMITK